MAAMLGGRDRTGIEQRRHTLCRVGRDTRELASAWTRYQRHASHAPSPALAPWVQHYWEARWDYAEPYRQKVVPYPNVHLSFDGGRAEVNGVCSRYQIKVLEGRGHVFGVAFRPGCFRPFLGASVSTISNRVVPAIEVFGQDLPTQLDVPTIDAFLLNHLPDDDTRVRQAAAAVDLIAKDKTVTRVEHLAAELGLSVRGLQRLFAEYVGIGPKWVIRRYRLHEATTRMTTGTAIDWAALAANLGYADQGHFIRDFKNIFGEPPAWYAQRY